MEEQKLKLGDLVRCISFQDDYNTEIGRIVGKHKSGRQWEVKLFNHAFTKHFFTEKLEKITKKQAIKELGL